MPFVPAHSGTEHHIASPCHDALCHSAIRCLVLTWSTVTLYITVPHTVVVYSDNGILLHHTITIFAVSQPITMYSVFLHENHTVTLPHTRGFSRHKTTHSHTFYSSITVRHRTTLFYDTAQNTPPKHSTTQLNSRCKIININNKYISSINLSLNTEKGT